MYYHFCHILLVTQTNPDTVWEGAIQAVNARRRELHTHFTTFIMKYMPFTKNRMS